MLRSTLPTAGPVWGLTVAVGVKASVELVAAAARRGYAAGAVLDLARFSAVGVEVTDWAATPKVGDVPLCVAPAVAQCALKGPF